MASRAEIAEWKRNLAAYQKANPGATAQDYADSIGDGRDAGAAAAANAQNEASIGISREGLALAKEQFEYQQEKDLIRESNIKDSMSSINNVFGKRQPIYDQFRGESFNLNERRMNELQGDASRNLNFGLARSGNAGGSVEIDKNREMAEKMGLGLGRAEIFAQGQSDALKAQDDSLKSALQGLAASGAVGGASMAGNARGATQGRNGTAQYMQGIDNSFSGLSNRIGGAGRQTQQQRGGF